MRGEWGSGAAARWLAGTPPPPRLGSLWRVGQRCPVLHLLLPVAQLRKCVDDDACDGGQCRGSQSEGKGPSCLREWQEGPSWTMGQHGKLEKSGCYVRVVIRSRPSHIPHTPKCPGWSSGHTEQDVQPDDDDADEEGEVVDLPPVPVRDVIPGRHRQQVPQPAARPDAGGHAVGFGVWDA